MGYKDKCKLDYCDNKIAVVSLGYCGTHYAQVTRYGYCEPQPVRTFEKEKKCDAPWCERMVFSAELCVPCYKRRTRYGLSIEQYISMEQKCEVCGELNNIHIDHNHLTGKFRGVLCNTCNTSLGLLKEDAERIIALAKYAKERCNV